MFIGEYTHTIDEKKRLSVPAKFRKELGEKAVITYGLNKALTLYPLTEWEMYANKLAGLSVGNPEERAYARTMLSGAFEVELDKSGRVLLPQQLTQYAQIDSRVVFTGMHKYVELWDEATWNAYRTSIVPQADSLAETLGSRGAI
jgi:MraZ protein